MAVIIRVCRNKKARGHLKSFFPHISFSILSVLKQGNALYAYVSDCLMILYVMQIDVFFCLLGIMHDHIFLSFGAK